MKKIISKLMGGVLLFSLSMSLTSCDDILGEWSKPTPNPVTPGGGGSSTINATAIDLDQKMKVLVKGGDALTIKVNFTPTDATDKTVTWESKDPTIATVENGVVTPVGNGITTITAKSGELSATCEVFVGNEVDVSSGNPIQNFDILKGTQNSSSITIPDGCKVAFNGVTTNKQIICEGTATIILADGSTNTVTVSDPSKAGIKIGGTGTTLTIEVETVGDGKLNVKGGDGGAGIGTNAAYSSDVTGGNIVINGGTVTANGGASSAGIGTGDAINNNSCGAITINGGTVEATGGPFAAGIGTGYASASNTCGAITIGTGVTSVTATKGASSPNSIGEGGGVGTQNCGTITFGTAEVYDGGVDWTTYNSMAAGTYGGLNLAISGDTWTLTPAP